MEEAKVIQNGSVEAEEEKEMENKSVGSEYVEAEQSAPVVSRSSSRRQDQLIKRKAPMIKVVVLKLGLHCDVCARKIKKLIEKIEDVHHVSIDWEKELVIVEGTTDGEELREFLERKTRKKVTIVPPKKAEDGSDESSPVEISKPDGVESSSTSGSTKLGKAEWTLLIATLLLECISAIFDQLGYALLGMVMAFIALVLSIADIIHMARKERISWDGRSLLPCFCRHSVHAIQAGKPFGTVVEYFGLAGAVWQCLYSTMQYAYARQNRDNPIKLCLLPVIFVVCVIIAKVGKPK